ncbi:MAG: 23S rRNA (adenine(2503)-C(2))-methyltransferase RlmN [Deltaproteobacteria bacterium]|nr:23S rRNA (adenine(2503)-C(2))-methyltransferase RlmN [Deltaproteobacteria bacterium]
MKTAVSSLPMSALQALVAKAGLERFRADQIFSWIHGRGVTRWDAMTNLARPLRERLAEEWMIEDLVLDRQLDTEDGTSKLVLATGDGHRIETVLIPEERKLTQCVSTQVGCRMGCRFCATAQLGLTRNLTPGEIVAQVRHGVAWAEAHGMRLSNLVYMGMGEPFDNYDGTLDSVRILLEPLGRHFSTRKITISTVGHIDGLSRLSREDLQVNLAVSLNATTQQVRETIMPASKRWPLQALLETLRRFPLEKRRRITLEYVLIDGVNDSDEDAERLASIARSMRSKVNLIRLNPFVGCPFSPPTVKRTERFEQLVRARNVTVILRRSRGSEIAAGCGQLALQPGPDRTSH